MNAPHPFHNVFETDWSVQSPTAHNLWSVWFALHGDKVLISLLERCLRKAVPTVSEDKLYAMLTSLESLLNEELEKMAREEKQWRPWVL